MITIVLIWFFWLYFISDEDFFNTFMILLCAAGLYFAVGYLIAGKFISWLVIGAPILTIGLGVQVDDFNKKGYFFILTIGFAAAALFWTWVFGGF